MTRTDTKRRNRTELIEDAIPQFESFLESRERYIKALESTIEAITRENKHFTQNNLDIRNSIDELVAMQRMANIISTATSAEAILSTLIELTRQVISLLDANIYLFDEESNRLTAIAGGGSARLDTEAQEQLESGVVDWVFSEKKTVIIPDLDSLMADGNPRNFVIVPLLLRNAGIGIYLIHTTKAQQEFSNQDIQLLSVLANQAAAGVENWRAYGKLLEAHQRVKASEAQMIQAAKLAAIGELAASIVHEIKNPVQVLVLQMEVMARGTKIPNADQLFRAQVERLNDITKRLMNFARNVSDDVTMAPVDVNRPIRDVVAMVEHEFRTDKIEMRLDLATELPPVIGNANYLQQVFLNLVINARDAMPGGGTISIGSAATRYGVTVRFADTGAGIAPEHREKLFQPFFTTKGEGKGTGLGLAICKKIVDQHQGTIRVDSQPGNGTTFTMFFPFRRNNA